MLMCELDVMEYAVTMEEVEVDEDFFDYEPDVDECGFNPYMGCYDFDCQSKFYFTSSSNVCSAGPGIGPGDFVKNLTRLFLDKYTKRY